MGSLRESDGALKVSRVCWPGPSARQNISRDWREMWKLTTGSANHISIPSQGIIHGGRVLAVSSKMVKKRDPNMCTVPCSLIAPTSSTSPCQSKRLCKKTLKCPEKKNIFMKYYSHGNCRNVLVRASTGPGCVPLHGETVVVASLSSSLSPSTLR